MILRAASLPLCMALLCACPVVFDDSAPPSGVPGRVALTRSSPELPGASCAYGGVRLEHGVDDDGDGRLSDSEVSGAPVYLCDGAPAEVVRAMLIEVDAAPAGACDGAGRRARIGFDLDGDALLDDDEVSEQALVCDGVEGSGGAAGLIRVSPEPPGASCPAGGRRIDAGLDVDADGALDESEVALSRFVCDGSDGPPGSDGGDAPRSLVRVVAEPPGERCVEGGQRVETGLDEDHDGALAASEIEAVAYVCDAQGEGVVLGAGRSEGSAGAPVLLSLDAVAPRLSTVAALGTSTYTFTTAAGEAPYTIRVVGEDSPLLLRLFDDATLANERSLACARDAVALVCVTDTLPAGGTFLLTISEALEVGNAFGLWAQLGADVGSDDVPLPLTDDLGVRHDVRASVMTAGSSTFDFAVPAADAYTLSLPNLVSSNADGLRWRIEDADGVHARCADATSSCSAGYLVPGVRYRLVVESAGLGAAFDVSLARGDIITPVFPLDELVTLSGLALPEVRVFQVRTTASTDYTFRSFGFFGSRYLTIFDAPPETEGRHPYEVLDDPAAHDDAYWLSLDFNAYVPFLAPERVYYIAIIDDDDTPNDAVYHFSSRGGDEALVPITVGTPHEGSVAYESTYRFTTGASPARYTITIDRPLGAHNSSFDIVLQDVVSDTRVALVRNQSFDREADDPLLVTPVLPAASEHELRLFSYTATVFTLRIEEGDTVSTALVDGAPVSALIPAGGVVHYAVEVAAPTAVALSVTGGYARVLSSDNWPESVGDAGDTPNTSFACTDTGCVGDTVLPAGRTFLTVENPLTIDQTFSVGFSATPATIALDVPLTVEIDANEAARFWYLNDAEVPHTLALVNPQRKDVRFRLRRAADFGVLYESGTFDGSPTLYLPAGSSGVPLPLGAWIIELDGQESYNNKPVTVTLRRP